MATLDLTLIGKVNPGTNPQNAGMSFKTDAPLDDRCAVRNKASLISKSAFEKNTYMYSGMAVSVVQSGDMYILINTDPTTITLYTDQEIADNFSSDEALDAEIAKHWKKLASASDISGLSGVFTFKGLAEAVSPDLSYIVVCTPSIDGREASPIGAFSDLEGEIYYGWENENGDTFYADSLVLNDLTKLYERGPDTYDMRSLEYNGDMYYLTTASLIGDDEKQAYENVSGEMIYLESGYMGFINGALVEVTDQDGTVLGTAIGHVYTAYTFIELPDPIPVTHAHTIITASPDNSGHVYQIGENEYASNGQIWVKLGSPVEDWIII